MLPQPDEPGRTPVVFEAWTELNELEGINSLGLCLEEIQPALRRLRMLVEQANLPKYERDHLLKQLAHIHQHLVEPYNYLHAEKFNRKN